MGNWRRSSRGRVSRRAQEDEHAKENKVIIKRVLTPAQIAKGQELAAKYWEKYVVPFQKD